MNISRSVTALAFAVLGAAAHAQGLYIGGSIGSPDWRGSTAGIDGDSRGVAGKIYRGYALTPNLAIEAGGVRLGSMRDATGKVGGNAVFVDGVAPCRWPTNGRCSAAPASRGPA